MTTLEHSKQNRIPWVDAAKGLAILLVIVGHTVPTGSFTRNIIFSFHIPLFFLLTGYTFHPSASWSEAWERCKKDAMRLLVPYVLGGVVIALVKIGYRHLPAGAVLKDTLIALLWGSGNGDGIHEPIGVFWFIITLFTARQIVNVVSVLFHNEPKDTIPVIGIISLLGFGIGMFDWNWRIFNFDVSMAASGFVLAGMEFHRHEDWFEAHDVPVFFASLLLTMFLMFHFGYIEMSGRWYPELSLGVFESICASYCDVRFVQSISKLKRPEAVLSLVGKHSLMLMWVHAVEDACFSFWKNLPPFAGSMARIGVDVCIAGVLVFLLDKMKRKNQ